MKEKNLGTSDLDDLFISSYNAHYIVKYFFLVFVQSVARFYTVHLKISL